jgi:hypothetical protein
MKTYEEHIAEMTTEEQLEYIQQFLTKKEHKEALIRFGRVLSTLDHIATKLLIENRKLKGEQNGR